MKGKRFESAFYIFCSCQILRKAAGIVCGISWIKLKMPQNIEFNVNSALKMSQKLKE